MNKNIINSDIFHCMETWAPKYLAYSWDNVGLQVGSYHNIVRKIMITLDVSEAVVDEAINNNVDLIIAHHPVLFKPLKNINTDQAKGRLIKKALEHNITIYASHTNLDAAEGGVNDMLANALHLNNTEVLVDVYEEKLVKLAVYVPTTHVTEVMDALSASGAGHIGNYSHCTFQTNGHGTFKPLEGTNPFIGSKNELEKVNEVKIETIMLQKILTTAINAMIDAHPYEEAAYDIYPLSNKGKTFGIGRIGELQEKITLDHLSRNVKDVLKMNHLRVTGDLTKKVKRIAILGGSGEKYMHQAKMKGAEVYITGDMTFHVAQDAKDMGLAVIDAGHYIEKIMKEGTKRYLDNKFANDSLEIIISNIDTDPFSFV